MPADHDQIGTPEWEAAVLRRQADIHERNGETEAAQMLRRRADERAGVNAFQAPPGAEGVAVTNDGFVPPFQVHRGHDPFGKATAEPGTTDQRDAHHEWMQGLPIEDIVGTDTAELFALLMDVADAEPVQAVAPGSVNTCAMCGIRHPGPPPFPHLASCPWVRVTQVVGTALPEATTGG